MYWKTEESFTSSGKRFPFPVSYGGGPAVSCQNETKMAEGSLVPEQQEESESTEGKTAQYCDHPVYREISLTNGKINKMKKDEVKRLLTERGLDSR